MRLFNLTYLCDNYHASTYESIIRDLDMTCNFEFGDFTSSKILRQLKYDQMFTRYALSKILCNDLENI